MVSVLYCNSLSLLCVLNHNRLVNDKTLTPPWCVTLLASGHSYNTDQLTPNCVLSTSSNKADLSAKNSANGRLTFPACHIGDSVYQTVRITNSGNIPAMFR
jgi:hypothetical protein